MKKKYLIISIISFSIILIGISYAFYTVQIEGTGKSYVINTPDLKVIFTDGTAIGASGQKPGEWTENNIKTFTVESQTDEVYKYNIVLNDYLNTLETYGYLQYKLEHTSANGYDSSGWVNLPQSKIARTYIIASNVELAIGDTHEYTLTFRYVNDPEVDQNADQGKSFSGVLGITKGETPLWASNETTLKSHILKDNLANFEESVNERTNFNVAYGSSDETFFKTNNAELGERVYYYAGDARNNWVIFGKCPETGNFNCTPGRDLYWRIIRTNEESTGGGIRLLYSGSGLVTDSQGNKIIAITQNGYIGTSNWYSSNKTPNYMGYTRKTNDYTEGVTTLSDIRGNEIDSNIKIAVDNWYIGTFHNTSYESLIDTQAIYCNDRSTTTDKTGGLTVGIHFGAYGRLGSSKVPSYACGVNNKGFGNNYFEGGTKEDKYTAEDENAQNKMGNGYLTKIINEETVKTPAALMTADEIAFAGGRYDRNNTNAWYYLNASTTGSTAEKSITGSQWWWTMSPAWFDSGPSAGEFYVGSSSSEANGKLGTYYVTFSYAIRPTVSLTANTEWLSGNGTIDSPYQIKISNN